MAVAIKATGSHVPTMRMSNDELAKIVDTTDEWIRSHTGIGARHFAPDGLVTSDLATQAGLEALKRAGIGPEDVDVLVVATATPDFFGFPSTACVVQAKLGATKAAAFDIVAGCTGFIFAMNVAAGMLGMKQGAHALVIGAETLSRIIDWNDRSTCVLFGDGSGAAVLEVVPDSEGRGIVTTIVGSDGTGNQELYLDQAQRTKPFERPELVMPRIMMNGKGVYMFAVKAITDLIDNLLKKEGLSHEDFRWIVPHQANLRIVQAAAKRFGIPMEKFYMNMEEMANTSAASIPIALHEMECKGLLEKGDMIMLLGFGAGLTYGGTIIKY
jgi:3-oxoacyl-[acyl-carrier-protein] synthase-3